MLNSNTEAIQDEIKWYVMQVQTGHEEKIMIMCRKLISEDKYEELFIPRYERLMKQEKMWSKVNQILFPGYIFIITKRVTELRRQLMIIPELTKVLGDGAVPIPLQSEEVEFLKKFGKEEHVVEVSTGVIAGDEVIINEGPMKGFEGLIKRIDRHKRIAEIEVEMFGRTMRVKVGLEIVKKGGV